MTSERSWHFQLFTLKVAFFNNVNISFNLSKCSEKVPETITTSSSYTNANHSVTGCRKTFINFWKALGAPWKSKAHSFKNIHAESKDKGCFYHICFVTWGSDGPRCKVKCWHISYYFKLLVRNTRFCLHRTTGELNCEYILWTIPFLNICSTC